MKIVIYDPLYSDFGHFYRYNRFICHLLAKNSRISEIIVLAENKSLEDLKEIAPSKIIIRHMDSSVSNIQTSSIQTSTPEKIRLYIKAYRNYTNIIQLINEIKPTYALFLSQGQLPFWLSLNRLEPNYIISAISIKWLYQSTFVDRINSFFYKRVLKKAHRVMFTERIYDRRAQNCGIQTGIVFPDRFLVYQTLIRSKLRMNGNVNLITLGTIAKMKSPQQFLEDFLKTDVNLRKHFSYTIAGKDMDGSMSELSKILENVSEVNYINDYLSNEQFDSLIGKADFVVIPYSEDYTKYATSGIMWDCFEKRIPIICPDIELFATYIDKYQIGYTYKKGTLNRTLEKILEEKQSFDQTIDEKFSCLEKDFCFEVLSKKFECILYE